MSRLKKKNNFIHSYRFIATRSPQDNGALFWANSQGFGICGQTSPLNQIYKPNTSAHINGHLWLSMSLKISRLPLASHTALAKHTFIFPKSKSFYLLVASTSTRICTEVEVLLSLTNPSSASGGPENWKKQ